jgi:enterobactin synthetase component D / holo-[acyl-carrier protein] synthase
MNNTTLASSLASITPPQTAIFFAKMAPEDHVLYPQESALTLKMSDKRLQDFRSSRYCAKNALKKLKIENFPLLCDDTRAPQWPVCVVGSISHCIGMCIVIASKCPQIKGFGVDVELASPLDEDLLKLVCTPEEISALNIMGNPRQLAKLIFSIKESVFKCLFPLFRKWIGFKDVTIALNLANNTYEVSLNHHLDFSNISEKLRGTWLIDNELVYSVCWV